MVLAQILCFFSADVTKIGNVEPGTRNLERGAGVWERPRLQNSPYFSVSFGLKSNLKGSGASVKIASGTGERR